MFDNIHEECGVFGIFEPNPTNVEEITYLGLYALQHRGQEACGIAVCDDGVFRQHKGIGLVSEVFDTEILNSLGNGNMAIGHVKYSKSKITNLNNIEPLVVRHIKGNLAISHNGCLTNASELRSHFELNGAIFHTTSDAEDIAYSIVRERLQSRSIENAVEVAMYNLKGAYSCCLMSPTKLIAFRDPHGFRPLSLGITKTGGYVVASETCAIDAVGAKFLRDILPGEILEISEEGLKSIKTHSEKKKSFCIFEYFNFARPDSVVEGTCVYKARKKAGMILAKESPVDADVVIGVPESGLDAAVGYSIESKIPYEFGFIKNKYLGRGFIKNADDENAFTAEIKLNVIKESVENKRVILIDDTILSGVTLSRIIKQLKNAGAKEVHIRISSPAYKHPCYFGSNIDSGDNLIANKFKSEKEIADFIGADSLAYLSIDGAKSITDSKELKFCDGCFTGKYPVEVPENEEQNIFEQKINR